MMYILDQRLKAQNIPSEKADKVLCDIVSTMLSNEFIEELFKPQELYAQKAMKAVFEKLVHSSIMKLNQTSMDKLYDLMTMVFKYQVYMCPTPHDLLYVTLNHLDSIRRFVASSPVTSYLVDTTHSKLITTYGRLPSHEMQLLRFSILNFFQDLKIRVSVFLKEQLQHPNGIFVSTHGGPIPHGIEIPGVIKEFDANGHVASETTFNVGINYELPVPLGSLDIIDFNRGTQLGLNIYEVKEPCLEKSPERRPSIVSNKTVEETEKDDSSVNENATKELALLAHLIGQETSEKQEFTLNLFSPDDEAGKPFGEQIKNQDTVVNIDFRNTDHTQELNKIMSDLNFDSSTTEQENDLLDLLDSVQ